jgi:Positive regulator of sigma E activity
MSSEITHEGEVIKALDGIISVRILQQTACSECHARSACQVLDGKEKIIEVSSAKSFSPGDKVEVGVTSSQGLKAVWYAFIIPLFLIFVALFILLSMINNEAIAIVSAIAVVVVYYYILYLFKRKLKNKFTFELSHFPPTPSQGGGEREAMIHTPR